MPERRRAEAFFSSLTCFPQSNNGFAQPFLPEMVWEICVQAITAWGRRKTRSSGGCAKYSSCACAFVPACVAAFPSFLSFRQGEGEKLRIAVHPGARRRNALKEPVFRRQEGAFSLHRQERCGTEPVRGKNSPGCGRKAAKAKGLLTAGVLLHFKNIAEYTAALCPIPVRHA